MKKLNNKGFSAIEGLLILVIIGMISGAGWYVWASRQRVQGNSECVSYVKKFEGKNFSNLKILTCNLEPRKIVNSSLSAQYLHYLGMANKDSCFDRYATNPHPDCAEWSGIVLSNGKKYKGIGENKIFAQQGIDYCYDNAQFNLTKDKSITHDLYFYNGSLYDRDIFKNTVVKSKYGDCILNGTTYSGSDDPLVPVDAGVLTNVNVKYENFPQDCNSLIGKDTTDAHDCIDYVTAATANLHSACFTDKVANGENDLLIDPTSSDIKDYKEANNYHRHNSNDCDLVYVQRMAALNRCNEVHATKAWLAIYDIVSCSELIKHPSQGVTRATTAI